MAEIVIIGALILSALWGVHKGLLESVGGVARIVASFVGASWASNVLTKPVTEMIRPAVEQHIGDRLGAIDLGNLEETLQSFFFTSENLQKTISEILANVANKGMSVAGAAVESIATHVAYAAVYVLAFIVLMVGLWLLMKPLKLMTKLPGLHMLNNLGGAAVGLIWGVLLVFLVVWAMVHFDIYLTQDMVEESQILQFFVYNSPIKLITSL